MSEQKTYKVYVYKDFANGIKKLKKGGGMDANAATKALAALGESQTDGTITFDFARHGESRLDKVEKYRLSDSHRLIVQLVDGVNKSRAFLFVGNHDDSEKWLENHKNFQWVFNKKSNALDFVRVSETPEPPPIDRFNPNISEKAGDAKLFTGFKEDSWKLLEKYAGLKEELEEFSISDYELNPDSIIDAANKYDQYLGLAILDIAIHAYANEWEKAHSRLLTYTNDAIIVENENLVKVLDSKIAREFIVDLNDIDIGSFLSDENPLGDWMVFLHPNQKKLVSTIFNGPARVRGVSGSGKTSVVVHRAKELAERYKKPIQVLTLTESTKKLMRQLIKELCPNNDRPIYFYTFSGFSSLLADTIDPGYQERHRLANQEAINESEELAYRGFIGMISGTKTFVSNLPRNKSRQLFVDEMRYVRNRFSKKEREEYSSEDSPVIGIVKRLTNDERKSMVASINIYEAELRKKRLFDHEERVYHLIDSFKRAENGTVTQKFDDLFRCILVDEAQDLGQIDLKMLANIPMQNGAISTIPDGLFFSGDETQSIFNKGCTFKDAGVEIVGRSFILKKNYRNTREILLCAYDLVKNVNFKELGENTDISPIEPFFAQRRGTLPRLVYTYSIHDELIFVANEIRTLLTAGLEGGQICVIATSPRIRSEFAAVLNEMGVPSAELRDDADFQSPNVKISTIESSKGHEFHSVYIVGMGEIRGLQSSDARIKIKDLSRLYVAMTRAREQLIMTCSSDVSGMGDILDALKPNCDILDCTQPE